VQLIFTPAEDVLLARGIRYHCYDWPAIKSNYLPGKNEKQLFNRKKNRTGGSAPENPIKAVVRRITAPLPEEEVTVVEEALDYYGKAAHRWETICQQHLKHRQAQV
jgi:hypothetical protein